MGHHLPPDQKELYRRVDEVLHYVWDPIGVAGIPQGRDEYYTYVPRVFSLVQSRAPLSEIVDFLVTTQTETMGLGEPSGVRTHAEEVAALLEEWRDWIQQRRPIV